MIQVKKITKLNQKHKGKFIKRQGLRTTIPELTKLKMNLIKQHNDLNKELKIKEKENPISKEKFLIGIINKQPKCSDTWRIENV